MSEFNERQFKECWQKTEIIREYRQTLYTFGDMKLPYIFVAEQGTLNDRTVVYKGMVYIHKPNIILPGSYRGPEFKEGFEHFNALPPDAAFIIRSMGLPYSEITNKQARREEMEYGRLQEVIDRFCNKLEHQEDVDTGLVKGLPGGADISLMRYSLGLMIKSAPENVKQFFEHIRRQRGEPIRSDEKITDRDIERLFG